VSFQYACCPVVAETIVGMVLDAPVRLIWAMSAFLSRYDVCDYC